MCYVGVIKQGKEVAMSWSQQQPVVAAPGKKKEVVADENEPMWQPTTLDLDELYNNINNNSLCSYQN